MRYFIFSKMFSITVGSLCFVLAVWFWSTGVIHGTYLCSTGKNCYCYWLVGSYNNAEDADLQCQTNGGFLAYIPNQEAMDTVKLLLASHTNPFFIGYEEDGGVVRIRNTSRVQNYTDWYNNEPNNDMETCIMILYGKWFDVFCSFELDAVCSFYVPGRSAAEYPQCPTSQTNTTRDSTTEEHMTTASVIDTTILKTTEELTTTTETTTTQLPTTESNEEAQTQDTTETLATTSKQCECRCTYINNTLNIQEITEQIKKEMTVDKTTLSSHIRKMNSAEDSRVSSASIGYVGVLIITSVSGCILLIDISNFIQYCKNKLIG